MFGQGIFLNTGAGMGIFTSIPINCTRRWTPTAIKCYLGGCNCQKCEIIKGFETITPKNCAMKAVVINLVKKFGKPHEIN